jgi:BirA family biotin operon repressor/biotin-[acetyl-CoA-carboxylase] ligase
LQFEFSLYTGDIEIGVINLSDKYDQDSDSSIRCWVREIADNDALKIRFCQGRVIRLSGKTVYHYDQVSSTNFIARLMAASGAEEGTMVMSESQSQGKGRRSRYWKCPPGRGILVSMILRPPIAIREIPHLTLLTGVAAAESLRRISRCNAGIKWPNDIIIEGKKVCGILAESMVSHRYGAAVIVGVGINVNQEQSELPPDCRETTTSLKLETGNNLPRLRVLEEFIRSWDKHYQCFLEAGIPYVKEQWLAYNHTLGRSVTVNQGSHSVSGQAVAISDNGGLLVRLAGGDIKEFLADDVSLGGSFYQKR